MDLGFVGMAAALGLSASGSAFGAGTAGMATVGAWKKCYAAGKPAPFIVGGRYGLSCKDTTPAHVISVYDNLAKDCPQDNFTISIVDDVTHLSLPLGEPIDITPDDCTSCKIWGLGADGTVGAN